MANGMKWLALCSLVLLGCSHSDNPKTYPTDGKVSFKGQPITSGMVLLTPAGSGEGATLTVYLSHDHPGPLRAAYERRFARIRDRLDRLPSITAHPSWPVA